MLEPTDCELICRVRAGDVDAYRVLFIRHVAAALRTARRLTDPLRAEDLCAEAFARILDLLRRGAGPRGDFRGYLVITVRTIHLNNLRGERHERLMDDVALGRLSRAVPPEHEHPEDLTAVRHALDRLPDRWREVLEWTVVDQVPAAELGRRLGIAANAAAALAYRARRGLREAYLQVRREDGAGR